MTLAIPEQPAPAASPAIYQAIGAVMRDTMPVGKDQVNTHQRYNFRGIDDLMSAVAGPLRAHGVFIVPEVVEHTTERRGEKMTAVYLKMRYRIYGPDGSCIDATVPGEAADTADKATNKAMSAALKYLLLTLLMIPVDARSIDDGDRDHPETDRRTSAPQQPQQGRPAEPDQWATPPVKPAAPSRDWLAEAGHVSASAADVVRIYRAAEAEGAPQHYLDQIADAGRKKQAAERALAEADVAAKAQQRQPPAAVPSAEHGHAVVEMYAAGRDVALSPAEVGQAFTERFRHPVGQATLAELRELTADLRHAAGGAAQ